VCRWLPIDLLAVPHLDDENQQVAILDLVDDAISPLTDAVPVVLTGQLFGTDGSRIFCKSVNLRDDPLSILFGRESLDFLGRGGLNEEPINGHAA
jgi:hypothetical protein